MSEQKQLFGASLAKDARYTTGECSDDVEILDIYSPAIHETVVIDKMSPAAAAH